MAKYSMTCTCGQVTSVEAEDRDEAIQKVQDMMTEEAIAAHFTEKHPGEPVPSKSQSDAMVAQMLQEGEIGGATQM